MAAISSITKGKFQLTEAMVFIGFLSLAVSSFLLYSQTHMEEVKSAALRAPVCQWDREMTATTPQQLEQNLFTNPSIEEKITPSNTPLSWQISSWGDNQNQFSYVQNNGHTGSSSLKVEITEMQSGDAKWEFNRAVPAAPETSYLFKTYYRSNVTTQAIAEVGLADSSSQFINLGTIPPSEEWRETIYTFVTPKDAVKVTAFQILGEKGYLITDDYYLGAYKAQPLPRGQVSLTFDDGAKEIYTNALPLMEKYDLTSTQYVITKPLADSYSHYYISRHDVQQFEAAGHEIGSHTVNHANLATATPQSASYEISAPQIDFYQILGHTAANFAVPYGKYTPEVIKTAKQYYCSHRSTEAGFNSPDYFDLYNIRVQNVEVDTPVETIQTWIDYAEEHKVWLVILFHEIGEDGGPYSYSTQRFEKILSHLKGTEVEVLTMSEGIINMQQAQLTHHNLAPPHSDRLEATGK
jgi:peptidoglycan/xylan/chitin deacetylase (PgdA/CDA1 family)